jgi:hypothetical protein
MPEVATSVDFNFSNSSGSSQKATVQTSLDAFNFDGSPKTDGIVVSGVNGQKITIGQPQIQSLLKNFSITEITQNQDAISKVKTYKLQDDLSLELESRVVLLRGEQTGPEGEFDYDDWVYNWAEVPNNIKYNTGRLAVGKQAPKIDGRVIIIGDLYNEVGLEDVKGEAYSRVYLGATEYPNFNKDPDNNIWFINYNWPSLGAFIPDRGSWQDSRLRIGYTLTDLKAALDLAGISHQGIPDNQDYLMDSNGTLSSVLSAAASQIGYYWYIDPVQEKIVWLNSNNIDDLSVDSYIDTTDPKIISSSYTESIIKPAKILAYNGNIQNGNPVDPQKTQKERKLLKPFKRMNLSDSVQSDLEYMMGIYYLFWNKGVLDQDVFDKIWYYGHHKSSSFKRASEDLGYDDVLEYYMTGADGSASIGGPIGGAPLDLYAAFNAWAALQDSDKTSKGSSFWNIVKKKNIAEQFLTDKDDQKGKDALYKFAYSLQKRGSLPNLNLQKSIASPSESYLFELINLFFESAFGGLYISSPISNYSKERMVFSEQGEYSVMGIFRSDTLLSEIDTLRPLGDFLSTFAGYDDDLEVKDLVKEFYPKYKTTNRYFAFAIRQVPKEYIKQDALDVKLAVLDKYNAKIVEDQSSIRWLLVNNSQAIEEKIQESQDLYNAQKNFIIPDNYITIPYEKRRNPIAEEDAERTQDDNDVPTETNFRDLDFNRDKRIFKVEQPDNLTNLNPLSLEQYSGNNKLEINALISVRQNTLNPTQRKSSSRTIYDLFIPSFSPLLSSISIKFGSDGVKTSITESNLDVLPKDENIIIDRNKQAKSINSTFTKVNAARKNSLGL